MRSSRFSKLIAVVIVMAIFVPSFLMVGGAGNGHNTVPVVPIASPAGLTQNGSFVKLTHIIPTNETYYGYHQVGKSSAGLSSSMLSTGTFSSNGDTLYVTSGSLSISEVNTTDWYTIRTINIPPITPPKNSSQQVESINNIVFVPSTGLIYATVVDREYIPYSVTDLSYLYSINPVNGSIVRTLQLENYASGLSYDPNNGMLYAVSAIWSSNTVIPSETYLNEINPAGMTLVWSKLIPGLDLKQMVFNAARNQLYIPIYFSGQLTVFNTSTEEMTNISIAPNNLVYAPTYVTCSSDYVYVVYLMSGNISVVNEKTLNFSYNISFPDYVLATSTSYDPGISSLYVSGMYGRIYQINTITQGIQSVTSIGTPTQALIYNNYSNQMYAVGSGEQAYLSVLGVGPMHQLTFHSSGLFGPKNWMLSVNGIEYNSVNGTVSFETASNTSQYYIMSNSPSLVLPWAGTLTGNADSGVTLFFVNIFLVILIVSSIAVILVARRIMVKKRK